MNFSIKRTRKEKERKNIREGKGKEREGFFFFLVQDRVPSVNHIQELTYCYTVIGQRHLNKNNRT